MGLAKRAPEIRASSEHSARASAINPFAAIAKPAAAQSPSPREDTPPPDEEPEVVEVLEAAEEPEPVEAVQEDVEPQPADDQQEVDHALFRRPKSE